MADYNPKNWYWIVANSTSQVYSSAVGDYVPVADPAYVSWLAIPNLPTKIGGEASLGAVLAPLSLRPIATGVLDGYTTSQANGLTLQVVAKVLFNHENRIRTLNGSATISPAQFIAFLKGLV